MKDKSYFIRSDLNTYKKKFLLLCNYCNEPLIRKPEEQKPRQKRIEIKEI